MRNLLARALGPPVLVFAVHVALSRGLQAYDRIDWLDVPMHLAGGCAIAACCGTLLEGLQHTGRVGALPAWLRAVLICALTCTAAVLWEFAEFLSDRYFGTRAQLSLPDTLGDLLLGVLGGLLYLAWPRWSQR